MNASIPISVAKKPRTTRISKPPAEPKIKVIKEKVIKEKVIKEKVIKEKKPRISKVKSVSNVSDDYYNNSDLDNEITSDSDDTLYMKRKYRKPVETSDMSTQYSSDDEC